MNTRLMYLKPEVITQGLSGEMCFALGVAAALKMQLFGKPLVVTALLDGQHNPGSLHPIGEAADIRTIDMPPVQTQQWFNALQTYLEPMGFDVVPEGGRGATPFTTGAHIHIEFQPKEGEHFWLSI